MPKLTDTVIPEKNLYKLNIWIFPLKSLVIAIHDKFNNKQSVIPQIAAKTKHNQY